MSLVLRRSLPRTSQPQGPASVDPRYLRDTLLAYAPGQQPGRPDATAFNGRRPASWGNASAYGPLLHGYFDYGGNPSPPTVGVGQAGQCLVYDGARVLYSDNTAGTASGAAADETMVVALEWIDTSTTQAVLGYFSPSFAFSAYGRGIWLSGGTVRASGVSATNGKTLNTGFAPAAGQLCIIAVRFAASGAVYINGQRLAAGALDHSWAYRLALGSAGGASGALSSAANDAPLRARVYGAWVIRRGLTDTELAALSVNPWQLLAAQPRRLWASADVAGGGGPTTLTADIAEPASLTDVAGAAAEMLAALTEACAAADVPGAAGALLSSLTEAAAAGDALTASSALQAAQADALAVADAIAAELLSGAVAALSEGAALSDTLAASAQAAASVSEAIAAADSAAVQLVAAAMQADALALADEVAGMVPATLEASAGEALSLLDAINGYLIEAGFLRAPDVIVRAERRIVSLRPEVFSISINRRGRARPIEGAPRPIIPPPPPPPPPPPAQPSYPQWQIPFLGAETLAAPPTGPDTGGSGPVTLPEGWTPGQLFLANQQGAWFDLGDLSTMFQDQALTIPVTAVGQPVAVILDKSGNGRHWLNQSQGVDSRGILRQDSAGVHYIELDGVDDGYTTVNQTIPAAPLTIAMNVMRTNTSKTMLAYSEYGGSPFMGYALSGPDGVYASQVGSGIPDYRFNGSPVSEIDRAHIDAGLGSGQTVVVEMTAPDTSAWSEWGFGAYSPDWGFQGRLYGAVMRASLTDEERAYLRLWLTALAAPVADALEKCVGPAATGDGSGSDWNNQAAWATVQLKRGGTYWIAAGTYPSRGELNTPANGSATITIRKATNAAHGPAAGWNSAYAARAVFPHQWQIKTSYWVIDGAYRNEANWFDADAYGFVIGSDLDQNQISIENYGNIPSHVHISCVHVPGWAADMPTTSEGIFAIYVNDADGGTFAYGLKFQRMYVTNSCNHWFLRSTYGALVEYCASWNAKSNLTNHGEIFNLYYLSSYAVLRFNQIREAYTDTGGNNSAGGIYRHGGGTAIVAITFSFGLRFYGNIIDQFAVGDGAIGFDGNYTNDNRVFHNTFIGGRNTGNSGTNFGSGTGNLTYNNLWIDCYSTGLAGEHDYNGATVKNWPGEAHGWPGISPAALFVDYAGRDYRLKAETYGIALDAQYATDMFGNTRGANGFWSMGALQRT